MNAGIVMGSHGGTYTLRIGVPGLQGAEVRIEITGVPDYLFKEGGSITISLVTGKIVSTTNTSQ